MATSQHASAAAADRQETSGALLDNRREERQEATGTLWLIDHSGQTVLRCSLSNVSRSGICVRAPIGYGVALGQRYELRSHLPGAHPQQMFGVVGSRWGTVVRTNFDFARGGDYVDIGMRLDQQPEVLRRDVS